MQSDKNTSYKELLEAAHLQRDLAGEAIQEGNRELGWTRQATCPLFISFLRKIMGGNDELVRYLQTVFGYCLRGFRMTASGNLYP